MDGTLGTRFIDNENITSDRTERRSGPFAGKSVEDFGVRSTEDYYIAQKTQELLTREKWRKRKVENKARQGWELYNSYYTEDDDKDAEQEKRAFPFVFMLVEKFAAAVGSVREQNVNWFEAEAVTSSQQVYYNGVKRWVQAQLQHPKVNFNKFFSSLLRNGLITSIMSAMVTYEVNGVPVRSGDEPEIDLEDPKLLDSLSQFTRTKSPASDRMPFAPNNKLPRLCLEVIDPAYIWLDTYSTRMRYKIWQTWISTGDLLAQADQYGYDKDACKRAILRGLPPDALDNRDDFQQNVVGRTDDRNYTQVLLTHFEGTLPDWETGENIVLDSYFVTANGEEVVKQPVPKPFWDGEGAVFYCPFMPTPNAVYGKSPITENLDAFATRHNLLNQLLDFFNKSLDAAYEVDMDRIHPDEPELDGVYPGKMIMVQNNGQTSPQPVIRPIANADLPQGFWQFMQFFQMSWSEFSGLQQELMGQPRSRGRQTGMEHQSREANGNSFIVSIFRGIEDGLLSPIIHAIFLRSLQYTPQEQWAAWWVSNIPDIIPKNTKPEVAAEWKKALLECAQWTPEERFEKLGGFFRFIVRVFSSLMERQSLIEQATFFLQVIGRIPQAMAKVRIEKLLVKICSAFGWDPEEVLVLDALTTPEDDVAMLKALKDRGVEALNNDPLNIPEFAGLGELGGLDDLFSQDFSGMDSSAMMDTSSGSPTPGMGGPASLSPNPVKPRF